jgi:putative aldouronate transport system substrate-binding protein
MWYYMPFIRDNGLKVPQTTDELLEYLKFVRDYDLNKNGQKDEVPLAFHSGQLRNFISCFAKSYLPWVQSGSFYGIGLENGKVVEQYKSEQFKQALLYMKKLYDENLILKDSFSMKSDQLRELGESPAGPTIAVSAVTWCTDAVKKAGESRRWYETFILPNVAGPDGSRYSGQQAPYSIFYLGFFVTNKCENVEAAVALDDYMLDFETMLDGYIGPKGECWDDGDAGQKSLMGEDARYKLLVTYGAQRENAGWNQLNPMIRDSNFRLGEQATNFAEVEKYLSTGDPSLVESMAANGSFNEINNYLYTKNGCMPYPMPDDIYLPALIWKGDDNARVADISAVLNPYLDQTFVDFITGKRDINSEWDTYLSELDNMGSAEMVSIMQKTYDAMK